MAIINLRGTNGSGKSTVAFKLIAEGSIDERLAEYQTPKGAQRFVMGYRVPSLNLIVVGKYETVCGGCDGIHTQDLIKEAVINAAGVAKNVLFEGVIVSTLFSGYLELSRKLSAEIGQGLTWAYLDTPLEVCLARIYKRNGGKPIKEELVEAKIRSIEATARKASEAGEIVKTIRHKRAMADVMALLVAK